MRNVALVGVLALAGCGSTAQTQTVPGFTLPAVAQGELQIVSPIVKNIAPGANITYCSYLSTKIAAETDVVGFHGAQSPGGHHALLYVARQQKPVDTHVCTEDDMLNAQYLAGVGADKSLAAFDTLPDGLAFRIPAGAQLMMQTHWINASLQPVDGQAAINLKAATPSPSRTPADLFSVVRTDLKLPAGQTTTLDTTCPVAQDTNIFFLGGHEHQLGTHVTIEHVDGAGTATRLYDQDWQPEYEFNPPIVTYGKDAPLVLKAGDKVHLTCSWDNTAGTSDVYFPSEMCVTWGFYFPGHGEVDCTDGAWPQN